MVNITKDMCCRNGLVDLRVCSKSLSGWRAPENIVIDCRMISWTATLCSELIARSRGWICRSYFRLKWLSSANILGWPERCLCERHHHEEAPESLACMGLACTRVASARWRSALISFNCESIPLFVTSAGILPLPVTLMLRSRSTSRSSQVTPATPSLHDPLVFRTWLVVEALA